MKDAWYIVITTAVDEPVNHPELGPFATLTKAEAHLATRTLADTQQAWF